MKTIKEEQLYALDRIGALLADLEHTTNEFDAEAKVYAIWRVAESVHQRMHELNSDVPHQCAHHPIDKNVFDFIFGKGFGV